MPQLDDYSLDPLQQQEDDLALRYKRAMAKTIRQPIQAWDVGGAFRSGWDNAVGEKEMEGIGRERKALANQFQQSMADALRGTPDDIRSLVMNPGTRAEGLKLLSAHKQQEMDRKEMEDVRGRFTTSPGVSGVGTIAGGSEGGAGGVNEYGMARALSESMNPRLHGVGKQMVENFKPQDPGHTTRIDAQGRVQVIPGALGALQQTENSRMLGKDDVVDMTLPNGNTIKVPRRYLEEQMQQYFSGSGNRPATPPASAPPVTSSALPGAAASAPISPVSGPPSGAPSGASSALGGTTRMAILQEQVKENYDNLEEGRRNGDQTQIRIATQNLRELDREMALVQKQFGPDGGQVRGPGPSGGGGALPSATAAAFPSQGSPKMSEPPATGAFGPSKYGERASEMDKQAHLESYKKWAESNASIYDTKNALNNLTKANSGPTNSGFMVPLGEAANYVASGFGKGGGQTYTNTRMVESSLAELHRGVLKMYGANPSNRDLEAVAKSFPTVSDDPGTRAKMAEQIQKGIAYHQASIGPIENYVKQGYSVKAAQEMFDKEYRAWEAQQQPRPTEASRGESNAFALPSARAAEMSHTSSSGQGPQGPTIGGFLSDQPLSDIGRNVTSLPKSLLGPRGGEALFDAGIRNPLIAAGQLTGLVDRENWPAEEKRQEKRKQDDPYYAQARNFYDIVNPVTLAGTKGAGVVKNALTGAMQGVLEPNATMAGQLRTGLASGAIGGAGAAAGQILPTTAPNVNLGPDAEALLKKFPSVRPTSSQLNPEYWGSKLARGLGLEDARALEQQRGLTKDLLADVGIKGDRITPDLLTQAKKDIGGGYSDLFKPGSKVPIEPKDRAALGAAIKTVPDVQQIMGQSPTLAKLYQALESGSKVNSINAVDLHQAWKDLGRAAEGHQKQESAAIRDILEGMIAKIVPSNSQGHFKELNRRWGAVEDIERIFSSSGGEGVGIARGTLAPGKLSSEAGRGPQTGTTTDEANRMANMLRMRNYVPGETSGHDVTATLMNAGREGAGKVLNWLDRSAANRPESVKKMIEMMRTGALRVPNTLYTGDQDAP